MNAREQQYAKDCTASTEREAALACLVKDVAFKDAVEGIKALYAAEGFEVVNCAAFDAEIQRACRAANHQAALVGIERSHENWVDANGGLTDGAVMRHLMFGAGIVGDWFFVPAMTAAAAESFSRYE